MKMKIVHWSDFNCPYSYIGLNRFKNATEELNLEFEWEMKAFELEPMLKDMPTTAMTIRHATKFGITPETAQEEIKEIDEIAKREGLEINYKDVQLTSSRNAHRLTKFVQNKYPKIAQDLIFKIFEANFRENRIIADINVLVDIAKSCKIDENEARDILENNSYDLEVSLDMEDARFNGLNSVPFYILMINEDQLSIPGAFEKEDFKIAIKDMLSGEMRYKTFI